MSTIIVLTPVIIASWPAITAAVTAAVGTMGFAAARSAELSKNQPLNETSREVIEVEDSEILAATAGLEEKLVVQRDGMVATFSRDARGSLRVCMEGKGHTKRELRRMGQELIDRVTQQYVYHRVVSELKERHMNIVDEEVTEDRTVKIRVRQG